MTLEELHYIQEAIRAEMLDGWLFCNFHHRDSLADDILHIGPGMTNSRWWVYAVPATGEPLKIIHHIEATILEGLPGIERMYISREDFVSALQVLASKRWGVHISETLAAVSYLDAGMARVFEQAGLKLVSAAGLVQRFKGLLTMQGIESHERAASHLYDIVALAWNRVKKAYTAHESLYEAQIRMLMLEEMERRGLITDHPPIVGAGVHSGNPHYDFSGSGSAVKPGDVVQFDLWAKEKKEQSIYADISWVGVFGTEAAPELERIFTDLVHIREETYRFIEQEFQEKRNISGAMVDAQTRRTMRALGYGSAIKHRTGHGIDTECHGAGVNIDAVEFPDSRMLLEGSCFSLEPGIYFSDFGMRTEINVYILKGRPIISGKDRQFKLMTCR